MSNQVLQLHSLPEIVYKHLLDLHRTGKGNAELKYHLLVLDCSGAVFDAKLELTFLQAIHVSLLAPQRDRTKGPMLSIELHFKDQTLWKTVTTPRKVMYFCSRFRNLQPYIELEQQIVREMVDFSHPKKKQQ